MAHETPPTIDPVAAARWLQAAPALSPWLHEEVARRMQERLPWIKAQPHAWCHWEAARGGLQAHELVQRQYAAAQCFAYDGDGQRASLTRQTLRRPVWAPARWLGPPTHFQAPPDASVQMLWANMALHAAPDKPELLKTWHQLLAVDGFLMFSCLGPDSFVELVRLYEAEGWGRPLPAWVDMHDLGDMMVEAGFADPVMDQENLHLSWSSPQALLDELRSPGSNLQPQRMPGLRTPRWRHQLHEALAALTDAKGRISLTFEVVYGHAFKAPPKPSRGDTAVVSLESLRSRLKAGADPAN